MSADIAVFLARHQLHVESVRQALRAVSRELDERAAVHDLSKLTPTEMLGFVRLAGALPPYGSPEYHAAIEAERPTVAAHYVANSHHPQHYPAASEMPWLDIVEMVCDWWGAARSRGGKFSESVRIGLAEHAWTDEQRWLIRSVADWLISSRGGRLKEVQP